MKTIRLEAITNNFTTEELMAIDKAHDRFFYAEMSDSYSKEREEKKYALEQLKKAMPNVCDLIPSFYPNENDIVIMRVEEE